MKLLSNKFIGNLKAKYCYYHPNEILIEFCQNDECIQPLCRKCVPIHIEQHHEENTKSNIDRLDQCLQNTYNQLIIQANELYEYNNVINREVDNILKFYCEQNPLAQIDRCEQELLGIIKSYFMNLRSQIFNEQPELEKLINIQNVAKELEQRWHGLMNEIQKLETEDALEEIIYYYQGDVNKVNFEYFDKALQCLEYLRKYKEQEQLQTPYIYTYPEILIEQLEFVKSRIYIYKEQSINEEEYVLEEQSNNNEEEEVLEEQSNNNEEEEVLEEQSNNNEEYQENYEQQSQQSQLKQQQQQQQQQQQKQQQKQQQQQSSSSYQEESSLQILIYAPDSEINGNLDFDDEDQ